MPESQTPPLMRLVDGSTVRTILAVTTISLLTAISAQVSFSLPFTPVPLTLQTGAVLLGGALLGWKRGATSQLLYLTMGSLGLPFFANGTSGWTAISGATGGYLIGFVVAAAVLGWMAEHGQDRTITSSLPSFVFASLIIYVFGVGWLAYSLHIPLAGSAGDTNNAIALGLTPFLLGDLAKAIAAAAITPMVWRWNRPDTPANQTNDQAG